jgi:integrase
MSKYKRGNIWWIEIDGIRESTGKTDPDEAQAVHDIRAKQIASGQRDCVTFDFAMNEILLDRKGSSNEAMESVYATWWLKHFSGRDLHTITAEEIELYGERKKKETSESNGNHYLTFLKTFFNIASAKGTKHAKPKGWIKEPPEIRIIKVDNEVFRALNLEEYTALMAELPPHLKVMVEFSVETGLRQQNVCQLKWEKVDIHRRTVTIDKKHNKNKTNFVCHLTDRALEILKSQKGKHDSYVFVYEKYTKKYGTQAGPITSPNNHAWRKALDRAGVRDFRWQDLRHTFATNHATNGTPLMVLKALGNWKSMQMVDRYANISAEGQRQYLGNSGWAGGPKFQPPPAGGTGA